MKKKIVLIFSCIVSFSAFAKKPFVPPIMGWSSWNTYYVDINDELIRKQTDAMVSTGLHAVGYQYINIDDGFFGWRDALGYMHTHPERFPNGLKDISAYIHSKGLKAGIYTDAGNNTCGSQWNKDLNGVGSGIYGYEKQDADLYFNQWGFDFIKIDYCGAHILGLDEKLRYMEIHDIISKVAKKKVSINLCRWAYPGTWAPQAGVSWRISGDIRPNWGSIKKIIGKNMYLSAYAGGGHYNDMDMLEIGRGMSRNEEEVHFGMWCIMSSPLLIGCDMTNIPAFSLELLKNTELIALNQDRLGLQAYVAQHKGDGYVFAKDLEALRGRNRAVALYNPTDSEIEISVPFSTLEFGGKVAVRDLINHENLGYFEGNFTRIVPARSVQIFKMTSRQRLEPTLYEAEWAYMPMFNDLGKTERMVHPITNKKASGETVMTYIGGNKGNYAEWGNVYSKTGGVYNLTVHYVPECFRSLEVTVNKKHVATFFAQNGEEALKLTDGPLRNTHDLSPEYDKSKYVRSTNGYNYPKSERIATVKVRVKLRPGYNNIRLGSSVSWAPDIDCITLSK